MVHPCATLSGTTDRQVCRLWLFLPSQNPTDSLVGRLAAIWSLPSKQLPVLVQVK